MARTHSRIHWMWLAVLLLLVDVASAWAQPLTPEQLSALRWYQGGGYNSINGYLRGISPGSPEIGSAISQIQSAQRPLGAPTMVYRSGVAVGPNGVFPNFMSTSIDRGFVRGLPGIQNTILVDPDVAGILMNPALGSLSLFDNEQELLLRNGLVTELVGTRDGVNYVIIKNPPTEYGIQLGTSRVPKPPAPAVAAQTEAAAAGARGLVGPALRAAGFGLNTLSTAAIVLSPVTTSLSHAADIQAAGRYYELPIADPRLYRMYFDRFYGDIGNNSGRPPIWQATYHGEAAVWSIYIAETFAGRTIDEVRAYWRSQPKPYVSDDYGSYQARLRAELRLRSWQIFNDPAYGRRFRPNSGARGSGTGGGAVHTDTKTDTQTDTQTDTSISTDTKTAIDR